MWGSCNKKIETERTAFHFFLWVKKKWEEFQPSIYIVWGEVGGIEWVIWEIWKRVCLSCECLGNLLIISIDDRRNFLLISLLFAHNEARENIVQRC